MNIEQEIQAKGLTAPRVTQARIADLMDRIVYTFDVRPNGSTTTLAHAFLDGAFYLATGVSACVSACVSVENFDAELGKSIATRGAKAAAEEKLWELEGYALRERLAASPAIQLTPFEVQSGLDRVRWAEGLIRQLPEDHDGRNSWLLNYGSKHSGVDVPDSMTAAARDVIAERRRQIETEEWSLKHDDEYTAGELAFSASCYALAEEGEPPPAVWPWASGWWKPRDRRSNLVRAAALILAEIERLDRAAAKEAA